MLSCSKLQYKAGVGQGTSVSETPEMERVKRNQLNISTVLLRVTPNFHLHLLLFISPTTPSLPVIITLLSLHHIHLKSHQAPLLRYNKTNLLFSFLRTKVCFYFHVSYLLWFFVAVLCFFISLNLSLIHLLSSIPFLQRELCVE